MPSISEEGDEEGEEEELPGGKVQIQFSSISNDATISGKKFCEVLTFVFPQKKMRTDSLSNFIFYPIFTIATPLFSFPPMTFTVTTPIHTTNPIFSSNNVINIMDDPLVT
jgi:hypothetical protein